MTWNPSVTIGQRLQFLFTRMVQIWYCSCSENFDSSTSPLFIRYLYKIKTFYILLLLRSSYVLFIYCIYMLAILYKIMCVCVYVKDALQCSMILYSRQNIIRIMLPRKLLLNICPVNLCTVQLRTQVSKITPTPYAGICITPCNEQYPRWHEGQY